MAHAFFDEVRKIDVILLIKLSSRHASDADVTCCISISPASRVFRHIGMYKVLPNSHIMYSHSPQHLFHARCRPNYQVGASGIFPNTRQRPDRICTDLSVGKRRSTRLRRREETASVEACETDRQFECTGNVLAVKCHVYAPS
jgi:hypothetical protein